MPDYYICTRNKGRIVKKTKQTLEANEIKALNK